MSGFSITDSEEKVVIEWRDGDDVTQFEIYKKGESIFKPERTAILFNPSRGLSARTQLTEREFNDFLHMVKIARITNSEEDIMTILMAAVELFRCRVRGKKDCWEDVVKPYLAAMLAKCVKE